MDREFDVLVDKMSEPINTTRADDHAARIDRHNQHVKQRFCCERSLLPYKILPNIITKELVKFSNMWINAFSHKDSISSSIGQFTLLTGKPYDYNLHCKILFGSYAQVNAFTKSTNTDQPRIVGDICLGSTGNTQGIGKSLYHTSFTEMNALNDVIA